MNTIVKMIFGSHLYGTDHELSDKDYKGVFLPTFDECVLNRIPKSINTTTGKENTKNTKDDIDEEIYSLQYFMKLACNGEMIVIDMLHAPEPCIVENSDVWKMLTMYKDKFYTKNLSGYLSYIRKQTARYCVKGSRLDAMAQVINYLSPYDKYLKMREIWDGLPVNEYCTFVENKKEDRWRHYQCCGKQIQETVTVEYAYGIIKSQYDRYGERARMAEANEGIDFKAVSHALRAGLQLKEIYTTGNLLYPLKDSEFLKNVKLGKYHYKKDGIGEILDNLLMDVEQLAGESSFPDKIDTDWVDNFVMECYR